MYGNELTTAITCASPSLDPPPPAPCSFSAAPCAVWTVGYAIGQCVSRLSTARRRDRPDPSSRIQDPVQPPPHPHLASMVDPDARGTSRRPIDSAERETGS